MSTVLFAIKLYLGYVIGSFIVGVFVFCVAFGALIFLLRRRG